MGFLSAFIGPVVETVAGVISSVSSKLAALAAPVVEMVNKVAGVVVKTVCDLIGNIAKAFGLVPENMQNEELGARAMQNPDITPEKYDSYEEYFSALEAAPFDIDEYKKSSKIQKAAYEAVGVALETKAIAQKVGMNIPLGFFTTLAKGGVTSGQEGRTLLIGMRDAGIDDAGVFEEYVNGEVEDEEVEKQLDAVMDRHAAAGGRSIEAIRNDIENQTLEEAGSDRLFK